MPFEVKELFRKYANILKKFREPVLQTEDNDNQEVRALIKRAIAYDSQGYYKQAIQDLSEVIRLNPQHALAYYNRGLAYGELRQYEQAIQDFDEAVRLDPDGLAGQHARAYYNREYTRGCTLSRYEMIMQDYYGEDIPHGYEVERRSIASTPVSTPTPARGPMGDWAQRGHRDISH